MSFRAITHKVQIKTNIKFDPIEVQADIQAWKLMEESTVTTSNHLTISKAKAISINGLLVFEMEVKNEPEVNQLMEKAEELCMEVFPHLVVTFGKVYMANVQSVNVYRPDGKVDVITHNPAGGYKRETIAQQKNA
jgi:hypothetical protein